MVTHSFDNTHQKSYADPRRNVVRTSYFVPGPSRHLTVAEFPTMEQCCGRLMVALLSTSVEG